MSSQKTIYDGNFVSVWAENSEVVTSCKVDLETRKVFDIETVDPDDLEVQCDIIEYEYVEYGDGKKLHRLPVYKLEDFENETEAIQSCKEDGCFWRE